ncbi:MAG TPA: DUF2946 family protein [Xanthobacteraceae bacterium]|nr:DUF2946 family protein [Xanthobacteraceae bacterium]
MRWFRANRRSCGWLALFALAVQIGLSFGHLHADDDGHRIVGPIVAALSGGNVPTDAGPVPRPADHEPHGLADDTCAICAVMALASSLVLPEAPALALPAGVLDAPAPDRSAALAPGDHPLQPRARSPPA